MSAWTQGRIYRNFLEEPIKNWNFLKCFFQKYLSIEAEVQLTNRTVVYPKRLGKKEKEFFRTFYFNSTSNSQIMLPLPTENILKCTLWIEWNPLANI